jgi:mannose-6-phosphate isomerase-like protein (cupin superfamily)
MMTGYKPINFETKLRQFSEKWSPKIIAELNDYQFKLAKIEGEFTWHKHVDTDEAFIILKGVLVIEFRDGQIGLKAGEMYVVPRGVEHKPVAEHECHILLVEPKGVVNTGDVKSELSAPNDVWI